MSVYATAEIVARRLAHEELIETVPYLVAPGTSSRYSFRPGDGAEPRTLGPALVPIGYGCFRIPAHGLCWSWRAHTA